MKMNQTKLLFDSNTMFKRLSFNFFKSFWGFLGFFAQIGQTTNYLFFASVASQNWPSLTAAFLPL